MVSVKVRFKFEQAANVRAIVLSLGGGQIVNLHTQQEKEPGVWGNEMTFYMVVHFGSKMSQNVFWTCFRKKDLAMMFAQ